MNFITYTKKQQETFDVVPLNAVDLLVISWLSYFDFCPVKDKMPFVITDLKNEKYYQTTKAYTDSFLVKKSRRMMQNIISSPRFQDMKLLDYEFVFDKQRAIQYASLAVCLDNRIIIAYKGTDASYTGWREDFNMSFRGYLQSYTIAEEFFLRVANKYQGPIIITGHSKGGHIATHILKWLPDISRIEKVYSFDGPGFKESIFKGIEDRLKIYHKIIPQSSLVGVLFTNENETEIIKSNNVMLFQHNPLEWRVKNDDFIYVKKRTFSSRYLDRAVNGWIESINDDEKERFTNIVFDAFENDFKPLDFMEFIKKFLLQGGPALRAYKKLNKEDKKLFNSVIRRLIKNFIKPKKIEASKN